ncbi:MAG: response regulator [Leptospiraceae bacterium]|nr:response regulator [Leptospiraceae bacterium]MDW7975597.1 response regulator [Leptospiraceae bacterium]
MEEDKKDNPIRNNQVIRILIVDDSYSSVLITKKFLELWNYSVDIALSGEEAIAKVKNKDFNLVLMDLFMPDMDGWTTTKKIREFNQKIPIIAITASLDEHQIEKIKEYEFQDLIFKPFKPKELHDVIIKHLNRD